MAFFLVRLHTLLHTHGPLGWFAINWCDNWEGKEKKKDSLIIYVCTKWKTNTSAMARDETDDVLPDKDVAKEFYAKYEPKEILGRYGWITYCFLWLLRSVFFHICDILEVWALLSEDVSKKKQGGNMPAKSWISVVIHQKMMAPN